MKFKIVYNSNSNKYWLYHKKSGRLSRWKRVTSSESYYEIINTSHHFDKLCRLGLTFE